MGSASSESVSINHNKIGELCLYLSMTYAKIDERMTGRAWTVLVGNTADAAKGLSTAGSGNDANSTSDSVSALKGTTTSKLSLVFTAVI